MPRYRKPTPEDVREMLAGLGPFQLRRAFYSGLNNPLWVVELAEQGAFSSPPPPVRDEAGYVRDEPWPEIDYLVRMARETPEEVVSVALMLTASENAWVRRGVVEIAAKAPADHAARLTPSIMSWIPGNLGARTDPRDLATIAENLLAGGQTKLGVSLANALYHPRPAAEAGHFSSTPQVALESYWFEESLPRIAAAFGDERLMRILPWLEDFQIHSGHVSEGSDLSCFGRPRISSRGHDSSDIENALVDVVRDAALGQFPTAPKTTAERLFRSGQSLSKKIALYVAATSLEAAVKTGAETTAMIEVALEWISDATFLDREYMPESADLMRVVATVAGHGSLAPLARHLEAGPLGSKEALVERMRELDSEDAQREADEYAERWEHRILAAIGAEVLPTNLHNRLLTLNEKNGVIEDPRKPDVEVTSWTGPMSPVEKDSLSELGPDALMIQLESWHPDPGQWRGPSHEGQGRELTALLAERPDAVPSDPARILSLRPTYLRAVLRGWAEAHRKAVALPWDVVGDVLTGIEKKPRESSFAHEGRDWFDDDQDNRPVKSAALNLIETALGKRNEDDRATNPPLRFVESIAPTLIAMSSEAELLEEYEATAPESFDPLTLSLNRRLPVAVRALTKLASWGAFGGQDGEAVMALATFRDYEDPHGGISAVFGEALSRLYVSSEEWIRASAVRLFGDADVLSVSQQIAVSTALATQQSHRLLLELLRPSLEGVLARRETLEVGWSGMRTPDQLVGDWIVGTFNRGGIDRNHPLMNLFFTNATAATRGDVLGHVGWSLMHAPIADEEVLRRVESLWDERVEHVRQHPEDQAELEDFYWYVRSGKFPSTWWLPRLLDATSLVDRLSTHGMIGEQLADASQEDPESVIEVLFSLMLRPDRDDGIGAYDLLERAVPQSLASALDSGDRALVERATDLMNRLGAQGYFDLDLRVHDLRRTV